MNKGYLRIEGESVDTSAKDESGNKGPEVVYDGAGNKIEVAKVMTEKEKKKAIKDLEKKMKDAVKKGTISDDEKWEMEDKLQAMKDRSFSMIVRLMKNNGMRSSFDVQLMDALNASIGHFAHF